VYVAEDQGACHWLLNLTRSNSLTPSDVGQFTLCSGDSALARYLDRRYAEPVASSESDSNCRTDKYAGYQPA